MKFTTMHIDQSMIIEQSEQAKGMMCHHSKLTTRAPEQPKEQQAKHRMCCETVNAHRRSFLAVSLLYKNWVM